MNKIVPSDRAHELRQELLQIKLLATEHFFRMGEILKEIRDKEYWKMGWESFESYYSDPELSLKTSSVYHSIKLIETFPKWRELLDIPVSKLVMVAPHINEKNFENLVYASRTLSRSDLRHELMTHGLEPEKKGKIEQPKSYLCKRCQKIKGVRFDDLCHCGWTPRQIDIVGQAIDKIELGGL